MGEVRRYIRLHQWLDPWVPLVVGFVYVLLGGPASLAVVSVLGATTATMLLAVMLRAACPVDFRLLAGPSVWCAEPGTVDASELQRMHVYFCRNIVDWDRDRQPRHTAMANAAVLAVQAQLLRVDFTATAERYGRQAYHVTPTAIRVHLTTPDVMHSAWWLAMGQWVHVVLYGRKDPAYRNGVYWSKVLRVRKGYWNERASERRRCAAGTDKGRSAAVATAEAGKPASGKDGM